MENFTIKTMCNLINKKKYGKESELYSLNETHEKKSTTFLIIHSKKERGKKIQQTKCILLLSHDQKSQYQYINTY